MPRLAIVAMSASIVEDLDFGDLLKAAFEDQPLTVEEDLGARSLTSKKRKASIHDLNGPVQRQDLEAGHAAATSLANPAVPHPGEPLKPQRWRNARRSKKRRKEAQAATPLDRKASNRTREEHVQLCDATVCPSSHTANDMPATNGAYKARNEARDGETMTAYKSVQDFLDQHPDFQLVPREGK